MLTSDMIEKNSGSMTITDFSKEVVENLLRFLYSFEELPDLNGTCEKSFEAAECYSVVELKVSLF